MLVKRVHLLREIYLEAQGHANQDLDKLNLAVEDLVKRESFPSGQFQVLQDREPILKESVRSNIVHLNFLRLASASAYILLCSCCQLQTRFVSGTGPRDSKALQPSQDFLRYSIRYLKHQPVPPPLQRHHSQFV